jgi:hypothetical protein
MFNITELMEQFKDKYQEMNISFDKDNFVFHVHQLEMDIYEEFTINEIIDMVQPSSSIIYECSE